MANLYVLFTQRAKEMRDEGDDEVQAEVNFLMPVPENGAKILWSTIL